MAYEIKDNTGSLFRSDKQETPSHPSHNGSLKVTAPGEYYISAWVNETKDGKKYFSLKLKQKDGQRAATGTERTAARPSLEDEMSDEIPF